uniref:CSON012587 protein n=1 Tax=Culicoides sonorensis TaxID=179676 RepID=A0A336MHW4_CULSO
MTLVMSLNLKNSGITEPPEQYCGSTSSSSSNNTIYPTPTGIAGELIASTFTQLCQTQHIRLPHIEEEEECDISCSNKTSPVEDDKVTQLPTDIITPKHSTIRLKQIRTIFNPHTLTTRTTTTNTPPSYPSPGHASRQPGFTSSIKLNRLLRRGLLRSATNNNSNNKSQSDSNSDTSLILQTTAAQIQKAQQKSKDQNSATASGSHVVASPAKMQAEQGSIGDLQKYHSRYLKNRRHTLANVRFDAENGGQSGGGARSPLEGSQAEKGLLYVHKLVPLDVN